jgi:hypothetical protein
MNIGVDKVSTYCSVTLLSHAEDAEDNKEEAALDAVSNCTLALRNMGHTYCI